MTSTEAITEMVRQFQVPAADLPRTYRRRCTAALKTLERLNPTAFDQVCDTADQVEQYRCSGGWYAILGNRQLGDMWPGGKVPRSVVAVDCAFRILESEQQRAEA